MAVGTSALSASIDQNSGINPWLVAIAGYIDAEVPGGTAPLQQQASDYYRDLQPHARETAQQEGVILTTEFVAGDEVQAIVECVQKTQSDLPVLGLHRHSLLFSRLWNQTTHDLVQQLSSSILGVH